MSNLFLWIINFAGKNMAPNWWESKQQTIEQTSILLHWQSFLVLLAIFSGLAQMSVLRGDLDQASLFGGLAICEFLLYATRRDVEVAH